jgi:hypothetical protein
LLADEFIFSFVKNNLKTLFMKKLILPLLSLFCIAVLIYSCSDSEDSNNSDDETFVGQDGNPRFNLQFTNSDNVDLDLYVKTPSGEIVYYGNPFADGGELDIDCLCSNCPNGPNENIFWENGTAPSGTYEYWVEYYSSCGSSGASSNFTLRLIKNGSVLQTKTGSLSSGESNHWTYEVP